jgi:hypothetical protein
MVCIGGLEGFHCLGRGVVEMTFDVVVQGGLAVISLDLMSVAS